MESRLAGDRWNKNIAAHSKNILSLLQLIKSLPSLETSSLSHTPDFLAVMFVTTHFAKAEIILWMLPSSSSMSKTFFQIEYWQQPFAVLSHSWLLFLSPKAQPVFITKVYSHIRRDWKISWKRSELLKIDTLGKKNVRQQNQSGKQTVIIFINVSEQQKQVLYLLQRQKGTENIVTFQNGTISDLKSHHQNHCGNKFKREDHYGKA